jgi:hypothetical protein
MKKTTKVVIICLIVAIIIVLGIVLLNSNSKNNENNTNVENNNESLTDESLESKEEGELESLISQIYEKSNNELYGLETMELDLTDEATVAAYTGLKSCDNIEQVVVSESMITSRAYSLVLVKTTENADVEAIKQEMVDNIDMAKWICVTAEVVYATNSDNLIFLVMSSEDLAKAQYDAFVDSVSGNIGKELVRQSDEYLEENDL